MMSESQAPAGCRPYRTLFVGTLVQESFLSAGGTEDPYATVDSPFCRDGRGRPTLRGTGLAGALVATLRRLKGGTVPITISGSADGRQPSAWRFFNSHPPPGTAEANRQNVAIDPRTGAAATGALFDVETLPPGTRWPFLLEVDEAGGKNAAAAALEALSHWVAGRCWIGRNVARGLGWVRLEDLRAYSLTEADVDRWPCARAANAYPSYIADRFGPGHTVAAAVDPLPGTLEITGRVHVGDRVDGYGIDSLSVGGSASEDMAAAWDADVFLAPDGLSAPEAQAAFDPDFAVVTLPGGGKPRPYIPGSSLRGPLRHAGARLLRARTAPAMLDPLFGTVTQSAKLLIRDALPVGEMQMAWLQHHAEDEFAGGAYGSAKFDRVAVVQGCFEWKMVLEDAGKGERTLLKELLQLAKMGQLGMGGGQWRGHGWPRWEITRITGFKHGVPR